MCLFIDTNIHSERMRYGNFKKLPKPFIARTNIVVYKNLSKIKNAIYTPYQRNFIRFNVNGIYYLESNLTQKKYPFGYEYLDRGYYIYEGIHSFTKKNTFVPGSIYYAIIPKGSMYYFGNNDDIVSDKLIIFKNQKAYKQYLKENNLAYILIK